MLLSKMYTALVVLPVSVASMQTQTGSRANATSKEAPKPTVPMYETTPQVLPAKGNAEDFGFFADTEPRKAGEGRRVFEWKTDWHKNSPSRRYEFNDFLTYTDRVDMIKVTGKINLYHAQLEQFTVIPLKTGKKNAF